MCHRMLGVKYPEMTQYMLLQADSCEDTRENTPDSDSGYVGSVVTVTSSSRTFPINKSDPPKASFLSEMQNVVQRRQREQQPPQQPQQPLPQPQQPHSNTLADQLRSRLEERRKSKEEDLEAERQPQVVALQPPQPLPQPQPQAMHNTQQAAFVPESMAADIQKAVKMANETSKLR